MLIRREWNRIVEIESKSKESLNLFQNCSNKRKKGKEKQGQPCFLKKRVENPPNQRKRGWTLFFSNVTVHRWVKNRVDPLFLG